MNNKRTGLAVLLCIMIILTYIELFIRPLSPNQNANQITKAPVSEAAIQQQQPNNGTSDNTSSVSDGTNQKTTDSLFPSIEELARSKVTVLQLEEVKFTLNHLGARIHEVLLMDHSQELGAEARYSVLGKNPTQTNLPGGVYHAKRTDSRVQYELVSVEGGVKQRGVTYFSDGKTPLKVTFKGTFPNGNPITKTYSIDPAQPYLLKLNVNLEGDSFGVPVLAEWASIASDAEVGDRYAFKQFEFFSQEEGLDTVAASEFASSRAAILKSANWGMFGGKYFMGGILTEAPSAMSYGRIDINGDHTYYMRKAAPSPDAPFLYYVGPKDRDVLLSYGYDLARAIDYGMFAFVSIPLLGLLKILFGLLQNYGLAIVALTLLVKLGTYFLSKKSLVSMQKLQDIQPKVKALQERYSDDKERLNQELMALYKEAGANPLGGCLPMVIQIPIFLGLYSALLNSIELRHEPFALWINDLSAPESLVIMGISIPVMILLMGASMFAQQLTQPSATMDPQQRKIMLFMPLIFTGMFMFWAVPSGLVLYWLVNNVISIIQQKYMKSNKDGSAFGATLVASGLIFVFAVFLTMAPQPG